MTSSSQASTGKPPSLIRRCLRFSLRGMFVVLTILFIALGWFVERGERQRRAVDAIEQCGGNVSYASRHEIFTAREEELSWKQWLCKRGIPKDWLDNVVEVTLFNFTEPSTKIPALRNLRHLKALELDTQGLKVADLQAVSQLTTVRTLSLRGPLIPSGLAALQPMQIEYLNLKGVPLRDDDLKALAGFSSVTDLDLDHTSITDAAMIHVGRMHNLKSLDLSDNCLTDAGLLPLHELNRLHCLWMIDTCVRGDGIVHLPRQLDTLVLHSRRLDWEKVDCLAEFQQLKFVSLDSEHTPDKETIERLTAALLPAHLDAGRSFGRNFRASDRICPHFPPSE